MSPGTRRDVGLIYTFYSYKGGVGRTMAVANVAALLAKWGRSVLVVDWDLEAPGIERFFLRADPALADARRTTPGIADLILSKEQGKELDWSQCLLQAKMPDSEVPVSILSAGRHDESYVRTVQSFNFEKLFAEDGLGDYIEKLRTEWAKKFEFVLIDSRTGITDIGGICTIHLPDILVLLFTTTDPSVDGVLDVLKRARAGQAQLPFGRARLLGVPVPARDESRTELEKWTEWKKIIAEHFKDIYKDWLPVGKTPADALDQLRIPYVPYWSFGERLPVIEQGTSDPTSLGFAYEVLARFIAADLAWKDAIPERLPPSGPKVERPRNDAWFDVQRRRPKKCLQGEAQQGYMEFSFYSPCDPFDLPQDRLFAAVSAAAIKELVGWPLVRVSTRDDQKPHATNDGVLADMSDVYWAANGELDFYGLGNLLEDKNPTFQGLFFVSNHVSWVAEALLFSGRLSRAAGANGNHEVRFTLHYGGLRGRKLAVLLGGGFEPEPNASQEADEVFSVIQFSLGELDGRLAQLAKKVFDPVCLVFDFYRPSESFYRVALQRAGWGK